MASRKFAYGRKATASILDGSPEAVHNYAKCSRESIVPKPRQAVAKTRVTLKTKETAQVAIQFFGQKNTFW
ncbi:MAG: hypothetical protein FWD76_06305 [Firmicutes bacterium]|nr:hypothetical protein [Bacillota bacterium]